MGRMATSDSHHRRFLRLLDDRRLELRLRWGDVARAAGISREALRQIRLGTSKPRPLTAAALERVLEWQPGSIDGVLSGENPATIEHTSDSASATSWTSRLDRLGLDLEDRNYVAGLLNDEHWVPVAGSLIELGELRGLSALRTGLDDVREEFGEQRRQRQRLMGRLSRMFC